MPEQLARPIRQIDPGTFRVFQPSTTEIGKVYAEGTAGQTVVEHWVLFDGYHSPTATSAYEVLRVSTGAYTSLTAFMSAMQTIVNNTNKAATYVKATCVYDSIEPE